MNLLKRSIIFVAVILTLVAGFIMYSYLSTEKSINNYRKKVAQISRSVSTATFDSTAMEKLPAPVKRYFKFVFPEAPKKINFVQMEMSGQFRRPLTETFSSTTASQAVATTTPALIFSATTSIVPGIWACAYDYFAQGRMEMKAKILSTFTVVDEQETPALNKTSLRRWLLESPLYPTALLPGGPVQWEPVDENRARAIIEFEGIRSSLVATFGSDGRLERIDAEEDGNLTTPYHGSGEHVLRSDYRLVSGMMIPFSFSIARAAQGKIYPFWAGEITDIRYEFQ